MYLFSYLDKIEFSSNVEDEFSSNLADEFSSNVADEFSSNLVANDNGIKTLVHQLEKLPLWSV